MRAVAAPGGFRWCLAVPAHRLPYWPSAVSTALWQEPPPRHLADVQRQARPCAIYPRALDANHLLLEQT